MYFMLIPIMKECLRSLYGESSQADTLTAALKDSLRERIAQLELQDLFLRRDLGPGSTNIN
jgi:hypothetical protein